MRICLILGALVLGASTLGLTASCHPSPFDPLPDSAVVRWGISFGECRGYCEQEMDVTRTELRLTRRSGNPSLYPTTVEELDLSAEAWSALRAQVQTSGIAALEDVYGCPDCADGGAEWVEVETPDARKKVSFDAGRPPEELASLVETLRSLRGRFPDLPPSDGLDRP